MINNKKIYNDILYIFILYALVELFNASVPVSSRWSLLLFGSMGVIVILIWLIRVFALFSKKRISKYSDVLMQISIRRRFFAYCIIPIVFYCSLLFFLYYNRNGILGHSVITICMFFFLMLFLNIRSSLSKFYSLEAITKAIYDFLCITIYYLLLNSFLRMGLSMIELYIVSFVSAFVLFVFILKLHDRIGVLELVVSLLCSFLIVLGIYFVKDRNVFIIPAIGSLIFYLFVSLWNVRFSGKLKFSDYLVPISYTVLAMVLILSF